jgi:hypothetical protein
VEINNLVATTTRVKVAFSTNLGSLEVQSMVVRNDPGAGFALKFDDALPGTREIVKHILEFVESTVQADADGLRYLAATHETR